MNPIKKKKFIIFMLVIFLCIALYIISWQYGKHNDSIDSSDLFAESEKCNNLLGQNQPEIMEWYPDTTITIWCFSERLWQPEKTWYIYTTTYSDLWLKVTTTKWNEAFFNKSDIPILDKSWDIISYNNSDEYIKVYSKSADTPLKDILNSNYDYEWCTISDLNSNYQELVVWNISNLWYSLKDKNNSFEVCPKLWEHALRFFESKDGTKFYEVLFWNWCAKIPCRIFEKIEVL